MKKHYLKTGSKKVMSAVLLAAAMMVGLAACGGNAKESKVPESSAVESTVQESSVEESTEESSAEETVEGNLEEGTGDNGSESETIEVRTYTLEVDGAEVEFEEVLFRSDAGYQVWYPTSLAEAAELDGYDGFVLQDETGAEQAMVVIAPADVLTDMDEMLQEAVAGYSEEAEVTIGEIITLEMEEDSILTVKSIEVSHAEGVDRYYAVNDGENALMISVTATAEAMEEMNLQFDRMASTVEFSGVDAEDVEVNETVAGETESTETETGETETNETESNETVSTETASTETSTK